MSLEVDATDVILLIQQYLKENNLTRSLETIQVSRCRARLLFTHIVTKEETGVSLNTLENVDGFLREIHSGHWDSVLQTLQNIKVPYDKLFDLYEQILFELVELRETETARTILHKTQPMELLRCSDRARFTKLESVVNKTFFEPRDATSVLKLKDEINIVAPSRLLCLLTQSLKYQYGRGTLPPCRTLDLFRNKPLIRSAVVETYPSQLSREIKFSKDVYPQVVHFSPDGQYLVTGSSDGFIEVWNYQTGNLRTDLVYQQQDNFMLMDSGVTAITFSRDSDLLVTASKSGKIQIWWIENGSVYKRFDKAHSGGINSLLFNRDHSHIISGGCDNILRIHGLKSGRCLREFAGHTAFVNDVLLTADGTTLISCSNDGLIKMWSYRSGECLSTIHSHSDVGSAVHSLKWVSEKEFIVGCSSSLLYIMNTTGQIVHSLKPEKQSKLLEYMCGVVSPKNHWYYAVDQDSQLLCFNIHPKVSSDDASSSDTLSSSYEFSMKLHDKETLSICHHPNQNIVCTASSDGFVKIWSADS